VTIPFFPAGDSGTPTAVTCNHSDCERPVVQSARRCRVHLAEDLRSEGKTFPFDDPELSGMFAAAEHIVRMAMAGLTDGPGDPRGPASVFDMYALLDPDTDWRLAQVGLDLLGTYLSDELGGMALSPPLEFNSKMLLRLQVSAQAAAAEELRPRLQFAMDAMIREAVGPDVFVPIAVELAEKHDGSST